MRVKYVQIMCMSVHVSVCVSLGMCKRSQRLNKCMCVLNKCMYVRGLSLRVCGLDICKRSQRLNKCEFECLCTHARLSVSGSLCVRIRYVQTFSAFK